MIRNEKNSFRSSSDIIQPEFHFVAFLFLFNLIHLCQDYLEGGVAMEEDVEEPFADGVNVQVNHEPQDDGNGGLEQVDEKEHEEGVTHGHGVILREMSEKTV